MQETIARHEAFQKYDYSNLQRQSEEQQQKITHLNQELRQHNSKYQSVLEHQSQEAHEFTQTKQQLEIRHE